MYTLQILDRGQTFLHPVDAAAVLLGSAEDADVRLHEAGVAAAHARIEPHAQGARLVALAPTRVNGVDVTAAELALGDRLELGRAVVVVGRSVTRAAAPEDVLAGALPRTSRRRARRDTRWAPFAAAAVMVGVVAWIAMQPSTRDVRDEIAALHRLRDAGRVEEAVARIVVLQA